MFNKTIKNVGQLQNILKKAQRAEKAQKKVDANFTLKLFEKKLPDNSFLYMNGQFDTKKIKFSESLIKNHSTEELELELKKSFNLIYNQVDDYRERELKKVNADFDEKTIKLIGETLGKKAAEQIKEGQKAQELSKEKQKEFSKEVFEEEFAQGNIKIKMSGENKILELKISPSFIDVEDLEMLEDSMIYAMNKMHEIVDTKKAEVVNQVTGALNVDKLNFDYSK
jgi:DNA-binding protein YbaB